MAVTLHYSSIGSVDSEQLQKAQGLFSKGRVFFDSKMFQKAIGCFLSCLALSSTMKFQQMIIDSALKLSESYLQKEEYAQARKMYRIAYDATQGISVFDGALSIEQNEYAISSTSALGTHSVGECVAIAFHHEDSATIGLAHVDLRTSVDSVKRFVDTIPEGKVTVHLIGGSQEADLIDSSRANLAKVKKVFAERARVELVDWTLDTPHPSSFVIDIKGNIHHDTHTPYDLMVRNVRSALSSLTELERPLRQAYVQIDGAMQDCPIKLSDDVTKHMKPYMMMSEKQLMDLYVKEPSSKMILVDEILTLKTHCIATSSF
jgi:hypothetical protein